MGVSFRVKVVYGAKVTPKEPYDDDDEFCAQLCVEGLSACSWKSGYNFMVYKTEPYVLHWMGGEYQEEDVLPVEEDLYDGIFALRNRGYDVDDSQMYLMMHVF